jgi:hypothetical protein
MKDEALKLALEALERSVATCFDRYAHEQVMSRPEHFINQAITAIKQALAAPVQPEQEPVAWPCEIEEADFEQDTITLKMLTSEYVIRAGKHWISTTPPAAAQPAQQELVGREAYMAIREARENASEDAYFAARPEHDKDLNRLMFRSGFYRGYPNTPPAAQQIDEAYSAGYSNGMTEGYGSGKAYAAAQHQWVGLTDDEQMALLKDSDGKTRHWLVWQVEAKLKEKNA